MNDALANCQLVTQVTTRLKAATWVANIYLRHPVLCAQSTIAVDYTSRGRLILGLGVSHRPIVEGVYQEKMERPRDALRQYVTTVRQVLAGQGYAGVPAPPQPAAYGVPIYIAALALGTVELAGELADGVMLDLCPQSRLPKVRAALERGAAKGGRTAAAVDLTLGLLTCINNDVPAARAAAKAALAAYGSMPFYQTLFQKSGFEQEATAMVSGGTQAVSDRMVEELVLCGPPARCREQLAAYRAVGIQLPIIRPVAVGDQSHAQAVRPRTQPPPVGFETVPVLPTASTIFPGLIELHNHLSYNALRLWRAPKAFANRDRWASIAEYRKRVSGPMHVIGRTPALLPALVRYVECKCLLGGVTTSQGIQLASNAGVRRFYRGAIRNVEQTDEAALPEAATRIADIEARDAQLFLARLQRQTCFLLHLAEGVDDRAREHFLALRLPEEQWAITPQLAGIHCAGLHAADFDVMARQGGAMIWSPLSNLLLYGKTAKMRAAKAAGVRCGMGSDWSPTGSKNLLGELKVARLYSEMTGGIFSDRDLLTMATRGAAAILQWDRSVGTLEAGKRADLLIIEGQTGDPYEQLLRAPETAIQLVMINGVARYGAPSLMQQLSPGGEPMRVGGQSRELFLAQATGDPDVSAVGLGEAQKILIAALHDLPQLAKALEKPPPTRRAVMELVLDRPAPLGWTLALDEIQPTGVDLRPRLPFGKARIRTGPQLALARASAPPLSTILEALPLDALTVADDGDFLERIQQQRNLPEPIKQGLPLLY
jgi:alkanesulfonate monooxygenase SsuD/methylene tetrahydromethanopterin reductase-like flavin-dependent oxidoreductase (luciferase family)